MGIQILADSACDLTDRQYKQYNIKMLPLTVHLDNKDYRDGIDILPKEIYTAMREGKSPTTSQVSPQTFKSTFTSFAKDNKPLLYVSFSSELSGTYQTAKMMEQEVKEEYPDAPIFIIDSKCASIGYGLVVLHAAKQAATSANMDDIIQATTDYARHMEHIFTVDDLAYLYRGGRVSKTAAFVGSLLKIKPLLHVDDGQLIPLEKIRGSKKVLNRMLTLMEKRGVDLQNQTIGISHGDDLERAEELAQMVKDKFGPTDIVIEMVGSVIGAHSGPGTIALFFANKSVDIIE